MSTEYLDVEKDYGYQNYYSIQELFYKEIEELDEINRGDIIHKNQIKLYKKRLKKGKKCQKDIKM